MYILPDTTIRLVRNCPLDNSYQNTIFFRTETEQTSYFFTALHGYTFENNTYQRVNKNTMRVAMNAERLYDCNYLCFQNSSFVGKWFYAFITKVEYINNITSEITYEIDLLQTWHFNYKLMQCFVEREHSVTDVAGENLVPEQLEIGEYVSDDFDGSNILGQQSIVVAATFMKNEQGRYVDVNGTYYSGIFSGLYYTCFPNSVQGAIDCADFIAGAGAKSSGIVSVFIMPTAMVTGVSDPAEEYVISKTKKVTGAIDGYTPKNKKLYTYPYNFLYVTNLQGNGAVFPYEYFASSTCNFELTGDMSPNPSVILAPIGYKGVVNANYDEKMVLSGYPQLPFNTDTFRAWIALNASSLAVSAIASAGGMYTGLETNAIASSVRKNPTGLEGAGSIMSGAVGALNILSEVYKHTIMPNQAKGGSGSVTACAIGIQDFCFMHKHIKNEFVRIVDDYFNMYGYATHRVKVPNRNSRPWWNYVKTVGCKIDGGFPDDVTSVIPTPSGGLPADDMKRIEQIYDNGITFWNDPLNIGNYSLDNSPTSV